MNIEAINRVIERIKNNPPAKFRMAYFIADDSEGHSSKSRLTEADMMKGSFGCGTIACIAGWSLAVNPIPDLKELTPITGFGPDSPYQYQIEDIARAQLGINYTTAQRLFLISEMHIDDLRDLVRPVIDSNHIMQLEDYTYLSIFDCLPAIIRQQAAILVLQVLRDTGSVQWREAIKAAIRWYQASNAKPA